MYRDQNRIGHELSPGPPVIHQCFGDRSVSGSLAKRIGCVALGSAGFPGETNAWFMGAYRLLADFSLDDTHLACCAARSITGSARLVSGDI